MRLPITLTALSLTALTLASACASRPQPTETTGVSDKEFGVQLIGHRWAPGKLAWDSLGRAEFLWSATVKNEASQPRKICVNYELLSVDEAVVASSIRCQVLPPTTEAEITGGAYVESAVLTVAKNSRATPTESHLIHSFVPKP